MFQFFCILSCDNFLFTKYVKNYCNDLYTGAVLLLANHASLALIILLKNLNILIYYVMLK